MNPANLLTEWAWLLVQSLVEAGIREVVISPGSRSTAFVLAALRHPDLRVHTCLDERAAAFFALGQARITERPSLLLCTSGTAPAHYFPAVIEATLNRIPLLVMSADRPLELVDCAAPQTIDQTKLFGDHVRKYIALGTADPSPRFLRASRRAIAQAVFSTRWPEPGAVHLNVRARKPFEPHPPSTPAEQALAATFREILAQPLPAPVPPRALADPEAIAKLAPRLRDSTRGLVLCGPGPLRQRASREALYTLCRRTGWPLLAETPSQLRHGVPDGVLCVDAFDTLLSDPSFRADHPPEVVLQVGAPPTAGAIEAYLDAHPSACRIVLAEGGWNDWLSTAQHLIFGELPATLSALTEAIGAPQIQGEATRWASSWRAGNQRAWEVTEAALASAPPMNEGQIVRRMMGRLPDGVRLMVGNSLAVRLVDWYSPARSTGLQVLSQRGANGIDGLIAGAAGAASVDPAPLVLLLGDVSALHDLNGLLLAREQTTPLVILVLNNQGGRIFELLPVHRAPSTSPEAMAPFTTPHTHDFAHAARLYGVHYQLAADPEGFDRAFDHALRTAGCTLLEVRCPPHAAHALRAEIRERLRAES